MGLEISEDEGIYVVRDIFGMNVSSDYGRIAAFLSSEDDLPYQMEAVSAQIWHAYNNPLYIHTPGRFTRALRKVAADYGFVYNDHVVYTGPLSPQVFMTNIQNGIFWKDSFAPDHGEYSHAFQWLAIARKFRGRGSMNVVDLYRNTAHHRAEKEIVAVVGEIKKVKKLRMWPWLCDCFPYSRFPALFNDMRDTFYHTYSDSFRCPNTVEQSLRQDQSSFVGFITRYRRDKGLANARVVKPYVERYLIQEKVPKGQRKRNLNDLPLISQAQTLKRERDPESWQAEGGDPTSRVWTHQGQRQAGQIPQTNVVLHNRPGSLPSHLVEHLPTALMINPTDTLRTFFSQKVIPIGI